MRDLQATLWKQAEDTDIEAKALLHFYLSSILPTCLRYSTARSYPLSTAGSHGEYRVGAH